jgi:hypothetical protein
MPQQGETFGWFPLKQHTEMIVNSSFLPLFGGGFRSLWFIDKITLV